MAGCGSLAAAVLAVLPWLVGGCAAGGDGPAPAVSSASSEPTLPRVMESADDMRGARSEPDVADTPPKIKSRQLTRVLDEFLASRGGRTTAMVKDLTTGRTYRYHRKLRLPTASASKANILMALLMRTPWRQLDAQARRDADWMIRYSDNKAADRLWVRIGGPHGLTEANRKLGLRHTTAIPGQCVDMYCWGITSTSAEDQVRLMSQLVAENSPVRRADRDQVLRLMRRVIPEQKWGISAAACKGDVVALKNGWLRHISNDRWAVVSVGLIRGHGHDYAVAVLTEDNLTVEDGIAKVEGVAGRILAAFRGEKHTPGKSPQTCGGSSTQ